MITVAVIDDHQVLIDALAQVLQNEPELVFAGGANTLMAGRALIEQTCPDVLLLDVGLPDGEGFELIPCIKISSPKTHIVMLTYLDNEVNLMRAIDNGVSGFLSKGCSINELLKTIVKAVQGEIVMPPSLLIGLLRRIPRERAVVRENEILYELLTPREREILQFLSRGKSGEEIASDLNIAPLTVRTHVRNLMSKLGTHSRLEAVAFGFKHGLIDVNAGIQTGAMQ